MCAEYPGSSQEFRSKVDQATSHAQLQCHGIGFPDPVPSHVDLVQDRKGQQKGRKGVDPVLPQIQFSQSRRVGQGRRNVLKPIVPKIAVTQIRPRIRCGGQVADGFAAQVQLAQFLESADCIRKVLEPDGFGSKFRETV